MSGVLGLKNTLRERVIVPLNKYRDGEKGGKEISFIDFVQTRAIDEQGKARGLKNSSGQPITWSDIWADFGIDPSQVTLDNLLTSTGDLKYLAPEIVRDFILKGLQADGSYQEIVAGTESVDSMVVTTPWIEMTDTTPEPIQETETIPYAGMRWGHKTIELSKKAKAIELSDELLLRVRLPILSYYMRRFGVMLSATLYNEAVQTLIAGDQTDGSDACAVIGVENVADGITFKDFLRAWIRCRRIAVNWDNMICSEAGAFKILQLDEFSKPQGAGSVVTQIDSRNRIIPSSVPQYISHLLGDNKVMLFDKAQGVVFLVFRPLLVESERIIMRQISGTACSIICGFSTIMQAGRVIIDGEKAFSSYGFPDYMAPIL